MPFLRHIESMDTRTPFRILLPAVFAAAVAAAPLKGRSVFESVNSMAMAIAHVGDARVWIAQRNGTITVFPNKRATTGTVFLKVASSSCLCINDEAGLIGLAFHPDFLVAGTYGHGKLYVYYSMNTSGHDGLFEYKVVGDPATSVQADAASKRQIIAITDGGMHHNAGSLAFDNDKNLLFGVGDGNVPQGRAWSQSLSSFHGKIMRIKVDGAEGGKPYLIPADNPVWPGAGRNEIFAIGLRNPYRIHWDKAANAGAGALVVGDVGQTGSEEVNIVQAGKNYGWGNMEGRTCYSGDCTAFTPPLYLYPSGGAAIIGGVVYRGKAMPARQGQYFFADYYYKFKLMENPYSASAPVVSDISPTGKRTANADEIFSFGTDSEGEVYAMAWKGIYILEETTPSGTEPRRDGPSANIALDFGSGIEYDLVDPSGKPAARGQWARGRWTGGPDRQMQDALREATLGLPPGVYLASLRDGQGNRMITKILAGASAGERGRQP